MAITDEKKSLFRKVRVALGAPVRAVELTDDQLCELLEMCIEDYSEKVNNWMIENQWAALYGKNVTNTDMAFAMSVRSLDMAKDYSYWFSKEVGLQQEGPWELKKDFITIEKGKQCYVIPSGRTVNKVMYVNPPMTDVALFANYGGMGSGWMPGLGPVGGIAGGMGYGAGMGGFYTTQAADVAYLTADLNFKHRLFSGDLVYKVTAGPNGTHILHLLSTPGSRLSLNYAGAVGNGIGMVGCQVWYTYYDTSNGGEDECIQAHKDDVILSPDRVPLASIDFSLLNDPTKTLVRQLLVAKAKQVVGNIRGYYSGKVSIPQAEMTMDYNMLIQQGKEEWDETMKSITDRLERMRPSKYLEEQANIMEKNREILKNVPLGIYTI